MLRVKNEARWIKRVIEAITPLCDAGIFVLDDGSTDNTWDIANAAGATIYTRGDCPGKGLDESRDKNWLMAQIVSVSNPDWILCIDGDEELQPGGAEKILKPCAIPRWIPSRSTFPICGTRRTRSG